MDNNFLDFISGFGNKQIAEIGLLPLTGLLLISLFSSFIISYLYVHFYKQRSTGSQIHRSFPLLGLSITAIFICIQFSLPLSLGLLGALSIVRFRTPIKEPEEIGFLMLLIASAISCATFNLAFLAIILLVATLGLVIAQVGGSLVNSYMSSGMLSCTIPSGEMREKETEAVMARITKKISGCRIEAINESSEQTVISASFHKMNASDFIDIKSKIKDLNSEITVDVFYNTQAG